MLTFLRDPELIMVKYRGKFLDKQYVNSKNIFYILNIIKNYWAEIFLADKRAK